MEPLDNQLTVNKLTLLYIIQQKPGIEIIELSDFVLFRGYMDYFTLQQCLDELGEAALFYTENNGCHVTQSGHDLIDAFRSRIPHSIRERIQEFVMTSEVDPTPTLEVDCEIQKTSSDQYEVRCLIRDYMKTPFCYTLTVEDEQEAFTIRNNWYRKGISIYHNFLRYYAVDLKS